MARVQQSGSWAAAGLVGLVVSGGYLETWWLVVERPTCDQTGMFACTGPAILMYLAGVPIAYLVWSLGLRAAPPRRSDGPGCDDQGARA